MSPETYGLPEEEEPFLSEELLRSAITGHPQGATRRIVLYVVLGFMLVALIAFAGLPGILFGGLGIIALLLLAMTDQLA